MLLVSRYVRHGRAVHSDRSDRAEDPPARAVSGHNAAVGQTTTRTRRAWRPRRPRWATRSPGLLALYRVGVAVVGGLVLALGIVLIPYPGPGWLVVFAGLAILAAEFRWAHRLLRFLRRAYTAWTRW